METAGLMITKRQGRYKLHHLDIAPLREFVERWPIDEENQR